MENAAEWWIPIPSHPGYEASSIGRVKSPRKVLKASKCAGEYLVVHMPGNKVRSVHRLVAEAFHGPCPSGMEVDHVNRDTKCNVPDNLEYVTHTENMRRRALHYVKKPRARKVPAWLRPALDEAIRMYPELFVGVVV